MRFYCESIDTDSFLDPVESRHLCRVLRAEKGMQVELFDGRGTLAEGVVERADKKRTCVHARSITRTPVATRGRIILAVSFAKGQRFDWLVEKCTELGVDHIAAVQFERTVKLGKATALERCQKISIAAAKQSKRLFLPKMTGPEKFPATLNTLIEQYPNSRRIYGDPAGSSDLSVVKDGQDCLIVIGPEGGFTENETTLLAANNAVGVVVNRHILRIETAAIAFSAAISAVRL